jgi:hypothetical protein
LSSPAAWVFYGGEAGGGKSWGLLAEPCRHAADPKFGAVIFRKQGTDITKKGGLWDEALELYLPQGARSRQSPQREFEWPSGARVQFGHLENYSDALSWKSAQITLLEIDQVEEIDRDAFWYITSRLRSRSHVKPYARFSCNPDPDCFLVHDGSNWGQGLISWWIDSEGLAIEERSGLIRWFIRRGDKIHFAEVVFDPDSDDSYEDAEALAVSQFEEMFPDAEEEFLPISLTFIRARLEDNPMMPHRDVYRANLAALPLVDRMRLAEGNWKIRPGAGLIMNRA